MLEPYYDPATHRYFCGNIKWPGVTEILKDNGRIDTTFYNEDAADRGTRLHRACERFDRLRVQPNLSPGWEDKFLIDVDVDIQNQALAYVNFIATHKPVFDGIEVPCFTAVTDPFPFGGCPDRSCSWICTGPGTLEIKGGAEEEWHGYQLAGYQRLRPRGARYVVYLRDTGSFKFRPQRDANDHRIFDRDRRETWQRLRQR